MFHHHDNPNPPPPDPGVIVAELVGVRLPPIAYGPVVLMWMIAQGMQELALVLAADPDESIRYDLADDDDDQDGGQPV